MDTVPDQLTQAAHGTRAAEENGVVFKLRHTVMVKHTTGGSINVWEWVLGLAVLCQDTGRLLVKAVNELEDWVGCHFWASVTKLSESSKTGVL